MGLIQNLKNYAAKGASKIKGNQYTSKLGSYVNDLANSFHIKGSLVAGGAGATAAGFIAGAINNWTATLSTATIPTSFPNAEYVAGIAVATGAAYSAGKNIVNLAKGHLRKGRNYKAAKNDMNVLGTFASDNASELTQGARDLVGGDQQRKRGYNAAKNDFSSLINYASADSTKRERLASKNVKKSLEQLRNQESLKQLEIQIKDGEKKLAALYKNSILSVDAATSTVYQNKLNRLREEYQNELNEVDVKEKLILKAASEFVAGKCDDIAVLDGGKIYKQNLINTAKNQAYSRLNAVNGEIKETSEMTKAYVRDMKKHGINLDASQILSHSSGFKELSSDKKVLEDDLRRLESLKAKK